MGNIKALKKEFNEKLKSYKTIKKEYELFGKKVAAGTVTEEDWERHSVTDIDLIGRANELAYLHEKLSAVR